jgi:hypothetical protein
MLYREIIAVGSDTSRDFWGRTENFCMLNLKTRENI